MKTARIGYIRVSSADQNLARQEEALRPYDLNKVFAVKASGKNIERIEFQRMIEFIREGDELYVCSMDRLARNLHDLLAGILHEWTNLRQMVTLYDFVFKPLILEKSLYKQT